MTRYLIPQSVKYEQLTIGGTILELTEASQKTRNVISKEIKTKTKSVLDVKIARC